MERHMLTLKQKAAIKYIVFLWKKVDKRPSRVDSWYPSYVQMTSSLRQMRKIINSTNLPAPLKRYVLHPIVEYDMLEKHSCEFYYDFDEHPSEHLEAFILKREKEMNRSPKKSPQKAKK